MPDLPRCMLGHHTGHLPTISVLGVTSSSPWETGLRNSLGWLVVGLEKVLIFSHSGSNMKLLPAQGLSFIRHRLTLSLEMIGWSWFADGK